jgi:hypothetical protein
MAITINGRPTNSPWAPILFGGVFAAVGAVPVGLALLSLFSGGSFPGFFALFGGVFLAIGLLIMSRGVLQIIAKLGFREAVLHPERERWKLGSKAQFSLRLDPKKPIRILGGTAKLTTVEYAYYSAGTNSRTYTDTLHEHTQTLALPAALTARLEQKVEVQIPRTIPPTWEGRHNRFTTTLEVQVQIADWPDLTLSRPVIVAPEEA